MKLIKTLSENIEDEIGDVRKYAKLAIEVRGEQPTLAQLFFELAKNEESHVIRQHDFVSKLIQEYRSKYGEPPVGMQEVYIYLHQRHIDDLADARRYLDIYQGK